jgi:hypothetical protein
MAILLKWISVLLFLSLPVVSIYGIMQGDIRFLFVFGVLAIFSILAGGFSDAVGKSGDDGESSLF